MPRRSQLDLIARQDAEEDTTRWRDRLWFALYYLLAFAMLGFVVSFRPPTIIDTALRPLAGNGLLAARLFTAFGLFPIYAAMSAGLLVLGFVRRALLRPVLVSIVTLVLAWQISDLCKDFFHRTRPLFWYVHRETSYSYPSGHAVLVVAFYGFWTALAWGSPELASATRRWIRIAFILLAAAVGWSRLALGAHFLTDVLGGYLLGAAMASFGLMIYRMLEPVTV